MHHFHSRASVNRYYVAESEHDSCYRFCFVFSVLDHIHVNLLFFSRTFGSLIHIVCVSEFHLGRLVLCEAVFKALLEFCHEPFLNY